jgi:hypothetical protein
MTAASLHEAMDMKNSMHKPVRRGELIISNTTISGPSTPEPCLHIIDLLTWEMRLHTLAGTYSTASVNGARSSLVSGQTRSATRTVCLAIFMPVLTRTMQGRAKQRTA